MELKVAHTMHQVYNSVQLYSLGAVNNRANCVVARSERPDFEVPSGMQKVFKSAMCQWSDLGTLRS